MQLTNSGFALIPDLTVPNTSIWLPAIMLAIFQAQVKLSVLDMDMRDRQGAMKHMHNMMQILIVASMGLLYSQPVVSSSSPTPLANTRLRSLPIV